MAKDHLVSCHKLFQHGSLNRRAASGSVALFPMRTYSTKLSTDHVKNKSRYFWEIGETHGYACPLLQQYLMLQIIDKEDPTFASCFGLPGLILR